MSRWLSPEKAARRAKHAAKSTAQRQQEKRRTLMLTFGIVATSVGLLIVDYFWLRHRANQKHERHHQHQRRSKLTNDAASGALHVGRNQATNHE